jgi:acyl dehydratase
MYFEDFIAGNSILTPEREITADDLDAFIEISGLYLPMFMRDEDARAVGHPKRLIPGPMILSVAMGLVKETGWFDHIVAVVGFDELRFVKAVHPGHSIRAQITIDHTRATKNPERGLVALAYNVMNQDKDAVFSTLGKYLMQIRL